MPTKTTDPEPTVTDTEAEATEATEAPKGRRVVHITTEDGRKTYPISALNEYDAMISDPSHGADQRVYETHVYWHAAGAPGDSIRDWLSTVTDVEFQVELPTPTPRTSPA